jgi:predicted glycosyltransferase
MITILVLSGGELFAQQRGTISIDQAVVLPPTTAEGNQVKVVVNYDIKDQSLVGQRLNAIMGIYDRQNGTLIKLSSFPNGFILNNTNGTTQLATTLTDPKIQNISAIVTLTNSDKTEKYTNDARADLDLRTILPTTLPPLLENIKAPYTRSKQY